MAARRADELGCAATALLAVVKASSTFCGSSKQRISPAWAGTSLGSDSRIAAYFWAAAAKLPDRCRWSAVASSGLGVWGFTSSACAVRDRKRLMTIIQIHLRDFIRPSFDAAERQEVRSSQIRLRRRSESDVATPERPLT